MKTLRKAVSVVLAVMMVLCMFTAMSIGASAAETNAGKITVTSNLSSPVVYEYNKNSEQVTVTYYLQADNMVIDAQAYCTYDANVLRPTEDNYSKTSLPVLSQGNAVANFQKPGKISFNSNNLNLFNFKSKAVLFTVTFDIIGSGDTTVNLNVQIITGTTANSFRELNTADEVQYVYYNKVMPSGFAVSQDAKIKNAASEATIYFAAPKGSKDTYTWKNVELFYGESTKMANNNYIKMTATGKVETVKSVGSLVNVVAGDWAVFSVTLTAAQVTAIDAANRVGFTNADNHNIRTDYRYANKISGNDSIAAYDGKMFMISGCAGTPEVCNYTGKWVDDTGHEVAKGATIYFAAPQGSNNTYTWKNVELFYGESTKMENNKYIDMTATGKVATVASVGTLTKVVPGDWAVFSVTLTAAQVAAIDAANRVGFTNADNHYIRTDYRYANKISGNESIAAYDGKMFMISGCAGSPEVCNYTGKWVDDTGHEVAKGATIYFAAPQGSKDTYTWRNVQLYYGESIKMANNKYIDMTSTGRVEKVASVGTLTKVVPGNWEVFSVTLTAKQIAAIDAANRVGFVNADNHNIRTDYRYANNISGNASIAAYDGKMFVINGCAGTPEVNTYIGIWK